MILMNGNHKIDKIIYHIHNIMKPSDKLCYYSKSKNVIAGKGKNETVNDLTLYEELSNINNWRQILSNFYVEPFIFEDLKYNSIEHAFQAKKISLIDKDKAYLFTIDSKDSIGLGNGSVAQKNRKLVKLDVDTLKHWDNIKHAVMIDITKQRILQSNTYANVLRLTLKAELWHVVIRQGIVRNEYLEKLRDNLL